MASRVDFGAPQRALGPVKRTRGSSRRGVPEPSVRANARHLGDLIAVASVPRVGPAPAASPSFPFSAVCRARVNGRATSERETHRSVLGGK